MGFVYNLISPNESNYPSINGVYYAIEQTALVNKLVYVQNDLSRPYLLTFVDTYQDTPINLITNGDFSHGITNWNNDLGYWYVASGACQFNASGFADIIFQDILTIGKDYNITLDYVYNFGNGLTITTKETNYEDFITYPNSDYTAKDIVVSGNININLTAESSKLSFCSYGESDGSELHRSLNIVNIVVNKVNPIVNFYELCIAETFDYSDIQIAIANLIISSFCGSGCTANCKTNTYNVALLLCAGLESARIYHENGDISKRDEILDKLNEIIASQTITSNQGSSIQIDLSEYNLTFAKEIYKYSLSEMYGINCCNKSLKELTSKQLLLKVMDWNNAQQYLSEASVDCLESKLIINNCNC